MKHTLDEVAQRAFRNRLTKELEGKKVDFIYCPSKVVAHPTNEGHMAYAIDEYSLYSDELSLHSLQRSLQAHEGVSSPLSDMINSMVLTLVQKIDSVDQGEGVVVYFAPKHADGEKFAKKVYTDIILFEHGEATYPVIQLSSYFLVAAVGERVIREE